MQNKRLDINSSAVILFTDRQTDIHIYTQTYCIESVILPRFRGGVIRRINYDLNLYYAKMLDTMIHSCC